MVRRVVRVDDRPQRVRAVGEFRREEPRLRGDGDVRAPRRGP